jgi:redox-sensing transcriptional repressor
MTVAPSRRLAQLAKEHHIHIGLIAVPVKAAQAVCDQLVAGGVKAIVNFAPDRLDAPSDVRVRTVDLAIELESLAFHLARTHQR